MMNRYSNFRICWVGIMEEINFKVTVKIDDLNVKVSDNMFKVVKDSI